METLGAAAAAEVAATSESRRQDAMALVAGRIFARSICSLLLCRRSSVDAPEWF